MPAYFLIRCVLISANTYVNLLALWLWELYLWELYMRKNSLLHGYICAILLSHSQQIKTHYIQDNLSIESYTILHPYDTCILFTLYCIQIKQRYMHVDAFGSTSPLWHLLKQYKRHWDKYQRHLLSQELPFDEFRNNNCEVPQLEVRSIRAPTHG